MSERRAVPCAILFLLLFFMSGVTATSTVSETTVSVTQSMGQVLFSLSSLSVLFLPLTLFTMAFAIWHLIAGRRSPGMLFAMVSAISFAGFLILYHAETLNNTLYNLLGDELSALGIKFRKRDFSTIDVKYNLWTYAALGVAGLTAALAAPDVRLQQNRRRLRSELVPYAYVGPHLFFFLIFFVTPSIYGIYAAFTKWNLFNDPVWVGFDNFRALLFTRGNTYYFQLRNGLWNTVKFVLYSVPFCILLPLALAIALQSKPRGNKFFQAMYYLPSLMSITTVTLTWRYMFVRSYGAVSNFLMHPADWLVPPYSWASLVIMTVWWVAGGTMVIYQSALASIPSEHYEAASVDGANSWHRFLHITIPGMRYPLAYTLVMAVVAQFNIYGQPLLLLFPNGFANQEANAVLLMYVYENAVKKQVAGMSAAMALILGLCIMVVSFVQMKLMRANSPA